MKPGCERALEVLCAARTSEAPDTPEVIEARRHLAACPPCRAFLRRDSVLVARIRDIRLCGATPCPEAIRAALDRELAKAEAASTVEAAARGHGNAAGGAAAPGGVGSDIGGLMAALAESRRRWPSWVESALAAAAAAVLIAGGLALSQRLERGLPDEAFVEDFHRTALPEIVREGVSPAEVEAFYRAQFGEGPTLMLDAPVTKVAVCRLEGRTGAMVEYDWAGERLAFYQIPRPEGGRAEEVRMGTEGELNLARWGDAEYEYALISAMTGDELARLAGRART